MSTNIYFILGAIAIAFTGYLSFLIMMMKKRNQKHLDEFNSKNPNIQLTEVQKQLLPLAVFYFISEEKKISGIKPE